MNISIAYGLSLVHVYILAKYPSICLKLCNLVMILNIASVFDCESKISLSFMDMLKEELHFSSLATLTYNFDFIESTL